MFYTKKVFKGYGELTLSSDGKFLTGLWFEGQKYYPLLYSNGWKNDDTLEIFSQTFDWLERYFCGLRPNIKDIPLGFTGSEFRKAVWGLLLEIPYGQTVTYREISAKTAMILNKSNMSARAVGSAIGHNPISIIVPCHRVIGTNRNLTGYAGGIARKVKLLELEGVDLSEYTFPKTIV